MYVNNKSILLSLVFYLLVFSAAFAAGVDKFVALGTGAKTGSFYPMGGAICDLVNKKRDEHGIRCIRYSTGGSIYNIEAIETDELDVGITRSDLTLLAKRGQREFTDIGENQNLRVIATLFDLPTAIIVKKGGEIKTFFNLKGSRFNLGSRGSPRRATANHILEALSWDKSYFKSTFELNTEDMVKAFCADDLDVIIEGEGHPSKHYQKMLDECGGHFLTVPKDVIRSVQKINPGYKEAFIPGGVYENHPNAVPTYGVKATLVTSARVHPDTIYIVTKTILENLNNLKKILPTLQFLTTDDLAKDSILIDLHPGALRYYQEVGLR